MLIKKVRAKNFLSIGNEFIEIDITKYRRSVIGGQNGRGKCVRQSTLIDVIVEDVDVELQLLNFLKESND